MFINAELSQIPVSDGRKAERRIVNMAGALRDSGATVLQIVVHDISTGGFKAEVPEPIEEGSEVWLKLKGFEAKRSRVVWTKDKDIGCEFEWPLHQSEIEQVIAPSSKRVAKGHFRNG